MIERSARDLGPNDFVWDYFSRSRDESMVARVFAAAQAGYAGVGIYLGAWRTMRDDPAEAERFNAALAETGVVVANIETLRGWASPDAPSERALQSEALAWEIADRYRCRYVQVIGDYTGTIEEASRGLGSLCDRAAAHGLLVGLEAVPAMTNIDSLGVAARIVEGTGRPNAGLCFDSWHLTRSTNDIADISALDGDRVFATQWNDGPREPMLDDYYEDTLTTRVPPGQGEFQLVEMVRALDAIGCRAPVGLEVPSTDLWAQPADVAASASIDAMRRVLREARG